MVTCTAVKRRSVSTALQRAKDHKTVISTCSYFDKLRLKITNMTVIQKFAYFDVCVLPPRISEIRLKQRNA
jgi:hypothetical protein